MPSQKKKILRWKLRNLLSHRDKLGLKRRRLKRRMMMKKKNKMILNLQGALELDQIER
jgi:hypothetical protein